MPVDETVRLKNEALMTGAKAGELFVKGQKFYNVDLTDHPAFMRDHRMEGVLTITCKENLDFTYSGEVYVNGEKTGEGILTQNPFGGTDVGLPVRKAMTAYGKKYQIKYVGAVTKKGVALDPYCFEMETLPKVEPGKIYPEHDELVLNAAREAIVLLKNDKNVLPLKSGETINAFGKGAVTFRMGCIGAGKINPRYGIRFKEGIEKYSSLQLNEGLYEYYRINENNTLPDETMMKQALELSKTAVIVLTRGTGESSDNKMIKGDYLLTDEENILLEKISKNFEKTIVILNTAYPIEMGWIDTYKIDVVLWCGLPGMAGGRALAEILEGKTNPSGKLPDTWAYNCEDYSSAPNFYFTQDGEQSNPFAKNIIINTVYEEGLYVGYRYFDTFKKKTAFPFGHGMSYTSFEKTYIQMSGDYKSCIECTVDVINTGHFPGKEVVMLYVGLSDGKLEQPDKRLAAFAKTKILNPGEKQRLTLTIKPQQLKSYDESLAQWIIEEGQIKIYLGGSVAEAKETDVILVKEKYVVSQTVNRLQTVCPITELSKFDPENTIPTGKMSGKVESEKLTYRRVRKHKLGIWEQKEIAANDKITLSMVKKNPELIDAFVDQLNDYELCRLSVGGRTGWGPGDNGFAGMLYNEGKVSKLGIPEFYMTDGNNGLNLNIATIGFPVSNSMCATFNEELTYEEGKALAVEALALDLQCVLAPAMNIHRHPLCGRHAEYFSEDPYLAGRMAGMQSKGIEEAGASSVMKHLFANNAENFRNRNHSLMTERTARELYLMVFEVAMDVHMPDAMMTGYNPANGCWCAGDEDLLQGILREEWHFDGYVMTDWGSAECCSATDSAQAGNSWIAPGCMDDSMIMPMVEAMEKGVLDRNRVRENVKNMYKKIAKYAVSAI